MLYLPKADPPGSRISNMEILFCPSLNTIAFLTYEGLTCNVRVTYAERTPSLLGAYKKFIDFMGSNTSGRLIRELSNKPSVSSK